MPANIPGSVTASTLRRTEQLWKTSNRKAQKDGLHHTVYYTTGERYQGEWLDDKRHGKGTVVYKNGDKYEGDWEDGVRSGLGTLWIFKEGKYIVRYNGHWANDRPSGHGTFYEDDGHVECEWQGGKANGAGRKVYPGGRKIDGFGADVYEGMFKEDMRDGNGTMMYGNGDIYEGSWSRDQKHGPGTFFYMSKGKRFDGVWHNDVPRCGTYSEIHAPPPGSNGSLPPIELANPQRVLDSAVHDTLSTL